MKSMLAITAGTVMLSIGSGASADSTFAHGYEFLPIRDAGNAPYSYIDQNDGSLVELYGRVNHEYRISSSVTTATQWAAFLNDFAAAFGSAPVAGTSLNHLRVSKVQGMGSDFVPVPGYENHGIAPSWRGAALYANCLHHGQTSDPEKLLIGAYDATTFGQDANGTPTDQYETLPGARFWIPSQDEYIKAAYYDPNRYGDGEGGYWTYPDASDTPLLPGLPEEGGETNAFNWGFNNYDLPIGSYADVRSAYGLLDASGMLHEWTSTEAATGRRLLVTNSAGGVEYTFTVWNDHVGFAISGMALPGPSAAGFRMATLIPTPASIVALGFLPLVICVRRR